MTDTATGSRSVGNRKSFLIKNDSAYIKIKHSVIELPLNAEHILFFFFCTDGLDECALNPKLASVKFRIMLSFRLSCFSLTQTKLELIALRIPR